jgi:aerobic C4-dicarboxylate transport protein
MTSGAVIGLIVVKTVQPGAGVNANVAALDTKSIQQYTAPGKATHTVDFSEYYSRKVVDFRER